MKILALEKECPAGSAEQFRPLLKEEALSVWKLQQAGLVREIYFSAEAHTAVLVLECETKEAARQALAGLSLVKTGLIEFELTTLVPYDGFARLFQSSFIRGEASNDSGN
jgi:hypothetical protein